MKLYKYCNISENSFKNLKNRELYFNNPSNFLDINDSNLKIAENNLQTFSEESIKYINSIPNNTLRNLKPPDRFYEKLKIKNNKNDFKGLINEFKNYFIGVTCFSESNDIPKMWNDYSSENKGFCICFESNSDKSFFKGLTKVNYAEKLPVVSLTSENFVNGLYEFYTTKDKKKYDFEEEQRIVEMKQGLIKYNENCVEEIILGNKITEPDKKTIINIIKEFYCDDVFITQN